MSSTIDIDKVNKSINVDGFTFNIQDVSAPGTNPSPSEPDYSSWPVIFIFIFLPVGMILTGIQGELSSDHRAIVALGFGLFIALFPSIGFWKLKKIWWRIFAILIFFLLTMVIGGYIGDNLSDSHSMVGWLVALIISTIVWILRETKRDKQRDEWLNSQEMIKYKAKEKASQFLLEELPNMIAFLPSVDSSYEFIGNGNYQASSNKEILYYIYRDAFLKDADAVIIINSDVSNEVSGETNGYVIGGGHGTSVRGATYGETETKTTYFKQVGFYKKIK